MAQSDIENDAKSTARIVTLYASAILEECQRLCPNDPHKAAIIYSGAIELAAGGCFGDGVGDEDEEEDDRSDVIDDDVERMLD